MPYFINFYTNFTIAKVILINIYRNINIKILGFIL